MSCTVSTNERTAMWKIVQVGNWQELFSVSRPKASAAVASAKIVDQITVSVIVKFVQVLKKIKNPKILRKISTCNLS